MGNDEAGIATGDLPPAILKVAVVLNSVGKENFEFNAVNPVDNVVEIFCPLIREKVPDRDPSDGGCSYSFEDVHFLCLYLFLADCRRAGTPRYL